MQVTSNLGQEVKYPESVFLGATVSGGPAPCRACGGESDRRLVILLRTLQRGAIGSKGAGGGGGGDDGDGGGSGLGGEGDGADGAGGGCDGGGGISATLPSYGKVEKHAQQLSAVVWVVYVVPLIPVQVMLLHFVPLLAIDEKGELLLRPQE
eukprot:1870574-Pleurochrysis_carterae.AAC.9